MLGKQQIGVFPCAFRHNPHLFPRLGIANRTLDDGHIPRCVDIDAPRIRREVDAIGIGIQQRHPQTVLPASSLRHFKNLGRKLFVKNGGEGDSKIAAGFGSQLVRAHRHLILGLRVYLFGKNQAHRQQVQHQGGNAKKSAFLFHLSPPRAMPSTSSRWNRVNRSSGGIITSTQQASCTPRLPVCTVARATEMG